MKPIYDTLFAAFHAGYQLPRLPDDDEHRMARIRADFNHWYGIHAAGTAMFDPEHIPLKVEIRARDTQGREAFYTYAWRMVCDIPRGGENGLMITTGVTDVDRDGVRAEVTIKREM